MGWAMWLAVPISATCLAALLTWWRGHRARRAENLDTAGAMRAHQDYLDALVSPARSSTRPTPVTLPSGTVTVGAHQDPDPAVAAIAGEEYQPDEAHSTAG